MASHNAKHNAKHNIAAPFIGVAIVIAAGLLYWLVTKTLFAPHANTPRGAATARQP